MAGCLLFMTTTTVLLGLTSGTGTPEVTVWNTTFPMQPGGELRLSCMTESDDDELAWYFMNRVTQGMQEIGEDYNSNKYEISYEEYSGTTNLTVFDVQRSDQGAYICRDPNQLDDYDEYVFDMPLGPMMTISDSRPKVRNNVTIMCMVEGYTSDQIKWSFTGLDDTLYTPDEFAREFKEAYLRSKTIDNKTGIYLELVFSKISIKMSGTYTCRAEGKSVEKSIQVKGAEFECDDNEVYGEQMTMAAFSCDIVTLTQFGSSNIQIRKYAGSATNGQPISPQRESFQIARDDDLVTTELTFKVGYLRLDDDDTKYKVTIQDIPDLKDFVIELKLMIDFTGPIRCQVPLSPCPGNYICGTNSVCACPQGMKPDQSAKSLCREGDSEESSDGDGDVTIVKHSSVATAVGVSMGVLGCIILLILGFVCYWRRKKQKLAALNAQGRGHYLDPSYLYQYEYHSEANMLKENPTFNNPGYLAPPIRMPLRKENTYVETERARLEFPREQLQLGVDLGQGRFGKVIQARAMNISGSGKWERVAVKTCRGTATDSEKQDLYQELEIMRKIPDHPNVVHLLGCCSQTDPLYIIMEYVQRGSMLNYLRKCRPSSRISSDSAISSIPSSSSFMEPRAKDLTIFALQIARGMAHIGSIGIIHRDLAARNILLSTDFTCKICDFGLARDVEGVDVYERVSKGPLPIRWMAPEALADNMYTRKSDVWSYGILLWEIVTLGATPYTGMSAMDVMRHVLQGYNLPRPLHCKSEMYELMECCWTDADQRPTFADIVSHQEELMDDDYIVLSDYDENDYGWLDSYTLDERV